MYKDWDDRPVVTNVATAGFPITEIPFPSVTICSEGSIADVPLASLIKQVMDLMVVNKVRTNTTFVFVLFCFRRRRP